DRLLPPLVRPLGVHGDSRRRGATRRRGQASNAMTATELRRIAQRLRVPLGFVLAPAFLVFARPSVSSLVPGAAIAVVGLAIRAWASGHLRKMAELTTSGPYAHTRNPLYFGTFLIVVGASLAGGVWWLACAAAAAYLVVYVPVMFAEIDTMR